MVKGTCRKHGELNEETGFRYISNTTESGYRLKCKQCFDERLQNYRNMNFDIPKPEKIKGICRKHGELDNETGFICLDKTLPSGYRIRCKECSHRIRTDNYYKKREDNIQKTQDWKKENRARINSQVREDRKLNPEKYKTWHDKYYAKNRDEISLKRSLTERNITRDVYDTLYNAQNGLCEICKQPEKRMARDGKTITRLCIDHDHDTNDVRALLCHDCNSGLGKFMDSPELLLEAAHYLIDFKGWTT